MARLTREQAREQEARALARAHPVYNKNTGEVVTVVGSRAEAREIAKALGGEVETEETVSRRQASPRRYTDEHGNKGWTVGGDENQKPLNPTRDVITQLLDKYPNHQKVTIAVRGVYGGIERWYGATGEIQVFKLNADVKVPGESFSERTERVLIGGTMYALQAVLQVVIHPAHVG